MRKTNSHSVFFQHIITGSGPNEKEKNRTCWLCSHSCAKGSASGTARGVQICRQLGGQAHKQTERRANFENERADAHNKSANTHDKETHRAGELGEGIFSQHLIAPLFSLSLDTLSHTHTHTGGIAKQSTA